MRLVPVPMLSAETDELGQIDSPASPLDDAGASLS
jgi:hypothetical protein